jgi:hypothetical protein
LNHRIKDLEKQKHTIETIIQFEAKQGRTIDEGKLMDSVRQEFATNVIYEEETGADQSNYAAEADLLRELN